MNEKTPEQNNDTLIAEIREEIGRERLERLWNKFRIPLYASIAFIIIGFSGYEIWKAQTEKSRQETGNAIYSAIIAETPESAITNLNQVDKNAQASQLATLKKAKLLAEKGDIDQAVIAYEEIYKNQKNDPAIAQLARLNAANLLMNTDKNHPKLDEIFLLSKTNSTYREPFASSLAELNAQNHLNKGRTEKAIGIYKSLTNNPNTPTSINIRAKNKLNSLGVSSDAEETAQNSPIADNETSDE